MLKAILLLSMTGGIAALIAYDCTSQGSKYTTVSLVSEPICTKTTHDVKTTKVTAQVLQRKTFDNIKLTQCLVTMDIVATHCGGFFGKNMIAAKYTQILQLTRAQCEKMHTEGVFTDPMFPAKHFYIYNMRADFHGSVIGSNINGKCIGDTFNTRRHDIPTLRNVHVLAQIKIQLNNEIATLDKNDNSIIFPSGYRSNYNYLSAFDSAHGSTFWNNDIAEESCTNREVFVIFEESLTKTTEKLRNNSTKTLFLVPDFEHDRDFLFEVKGNTSICGEFAFLTQSISLFIVESSNGIFKNRKEITTNIKNLDQELMVNMKISHLTFTTSTQMKELYASLAHEQCLIEANVIINKLSIAKLDAKNFGFAFFKAPGYLGTVRSEVIYLQECEPTNVTHRPTAECFQELPIWHEDKPKFMTPKSRLIIDHGEQLDCDPIMNNLYKIDSIWYNRINGQLIRSQTPIELTLRPTSEWSHTFDDKLAFTGIYSSNDVDNWKKGIKNPLNTPAELHNFVRGMKGDAAFPKHLSIVDSISEEDTTKLKAKIETTWWQKILGSNTGLAVMVIGSLFTLHITGVIKAVIEMIINMMIVRKLYGWCNFRILFCCCNHIIGLLLHKRRNKDRRTATATEDLEAANDATRSALTPAAAARVLNTDAKI